METAILSERDHIKAVGARLRQLIQALDISFSEAARDMCVSRNHLGNWMRGTAYPREYAIYRFCRIRGVNTDWLYLADPSALPRRVVEALLELEREPADPAERETQAFESSKRVKAN